MRFKGLDLNHLVTLEVLLVERHLTRASERLNLTQPAVSNALTKLREHFDDPLLIRRGREMCPTPFAEQLLKPLQETLHRIHEIAAARPRFEAATASRTYKIVASDYISMMLIGNLMLHLSKIAPHIRIEILPINDENIGKFSRGEADATIQPDGEKTLTSFARRHLFDENFVCIASKNNHSVGTTLSTAEFYTLPRVAPPYKKYWPDGHLHHVEIVPAIPMPFPSIPLFVANSDHIAIIPERLAQTFEPVLPLRRIRLTPATPHVSFHVQWHAASSADPFQIWMLEQIENAAHAPRVGDHPKADMDRQHARADQSVVNR